jgi:hypothetical protein
VCRNPNGTADVLLYVVVFFGCLHERNIQSQEILMPARSILPARFCALFILCGTASISFAQNQKDSDYVTSFLIGGSIVGNSPQTATGTIVIHRAYSGARGYLASADLGLSYTFRDGNVTQRSRLLHPRWFQFHYR